MLAICCFLSTKFQVEALITRMLQRSFLSCFRPFRPYMILKGPRPPYLPFHSQTITSKTYIFLYALCVSKTVITIKANGAAVLCSYMVQEPPKRQIASGAAALSPYMVRKPPKTSKS